MSSENRLYYVLLILLLIFPSCIPLVSANSDGASIDVSTISLQDFESTEDSFYQLEFDIEVIGTPSNPLSYGNISFEMQTISGTSLFTTIQNFSLTTSESLTIVQNFTNIPYGYVSISVEMTGDVAFSSPTHVLSFQRTLQRLTPLNIALGQSNSIIIEGIDSLGQYTGNLSVNDGDYIQLQIPVVNDGDFDWNGTITVNVSDSVSYENTTSEVIHVPAMQTIIYLSNSTIMMNEGLVSIYIELNYSNDGNSLDESVLFSAQINPPPLPIISLIIEQYTTEIIAGNLMYWNLTISNTGAVAFDGYISCQFNEQIILNNTVQSLPSSQSNISISTTARPGLLECVASGDRISAQSQFEANLTLQVESAEFEAAGGTIPAALMGPWHEGDDARLSLLVRNHGSKSGHIRIVCEVGGMSYFGNLIELGVDEAGEISIDIPLMNEGLEMLNWSLDSYDGSIDPGLVGSLNLSVAQRQTIEISIPLVSWDEEEGLSFDWGVSLSEGVNRDVRIRLGYIDSLEEVFLVDVIMSLPPGLTEGSIDVGFVDAEKIIVRATEENWIAGFSFSSLSVDTPQERPVYSISFDPQTTPNRPSFGDDSIVRVNLENTGLVSGSQSVLIIKTSSGKLIEERIIPTIDSQSTSSQEFSLIWPEGDEVSLVATWTVSQQILSAEEIFISSATQAGGESYEVPWAGLLGGIALAAVFILVVRFKNSRPKQIAVEQKNKPDVVSKDPSVNNIKIQIGCPECSRQLRIPSNYTGTVRCPDCEHSFEVEEKKDPTRDFNGNSAEEREEEIEIPNDGKLEVGCPECSQTLRIPSSYSGSVRCPACKNIFGTN